MFGGGNPVGGSNPSGTGGSINYIGDFAYAYSGPITVNNNQTTLIKFTTGASLFVGTFRPSYTTSTSDNYGWTIKINDEIIGYSEFISATPQGSITSEFDLIIAPFSKVEIVAQNTEDTDNNDVAALITGRVY
jgi:hypothetical protein